MHTYIHTHIVTFQTRNLTRDVTGIPQRTAQGISQRTPPGTSQGNPQRISKNDDDHADDDDDDDDDDLDDDGDGDDWPAPFTTANLLTCLRMPTKRTKPQMLKICR
jgi:hypothetical protein